MAIDFRNPLASRSALLTRLCSMLGGNGRQPDTAATTVSVRDTDRVRLSSAALRMAGVFESGAPGTQADAERIAAIKQAIETGTFRIDTSRIANKVSLQYGSGR